MEREVKMKRQELLISIEVTPNEVIALNVAVHYYFKYFERISPEYKEISALLRQFQDRLILHLEVPTMEKRVCH
jgi:hypothetical protein